MQEIVKIACYNFNLNKLAFKKLSYSKKRIFLRSNTVSNGKKIQDMPKASVIRSISTPHTEIRIEDSHESSKKTHMVDFEHHQKAMNSISDEKLEVPIFLISCLMYL